MIRIIVTGGVQSWDHNHFIKMHETVISRHDQLLHFEMVIVTPKCMVECFFHDGDDVILIA